MICRALEALHNSYRDAKSETNKFHTPYKYLDVIKTNGPREGRTKLSKPTVQNAPFLFNNCEICELSSESLSTKESIKDIKPVIKSNAELICQYQNLLEVMWWCGGDVKL